MTVSSAQNAIGSRNEMRKRLAWATIATLILVVAYSSFVEPARLVVLRQELDIPNWPAELAGLRVVLVSDLHVGSPHWGLARTERLVQQINAEHADMILLAGDYMINGVKFGTRVPEPVVANAIGGLRAPLGVVAVFGNHDGWHGRRLRRGLEAHGVRVLDDQVYRVETRGASFCVLGLSDQETRSLTPQQQLALAPSGLPLLVLVHEPDIFPELDQRVSLALAGHTHGGQVRLPFIGSPVVRSRYGQRYVRGHVVENGRHLFVTTGIGTSIWPVRLGVPPEYVVLTLR